MFDVLLLSAPVALGCWIGLARFNARYRMATRPPDSPYAVTFDQIEGLGRDE